MVATLASVAVHAVVVAVFLFHETAAVNMGEIIIVNLVISEEDARTANRPTSKAAGRDAKTAVETGADAEEVRSAPPISEATKVAFPVPQPLATIEPQPAPPPPVKSPVPSVEDVPRMPAGTFTLPPRRSPGIRSPPPEPSENVQAPEQPLPETVSIEPVNTVADDFDRAKEGRTKKDTHQANRAEEQASKLGSGAGSQTVPGELTEQAAVYGGRIKAAPLEDNPRPPYPARAIRRGWQGRVVLNVEVLPTGAVGEIKIETSSGYGVLDRAALKTVRQWRFKPATRAGSPVRVQAQVPVLFKLTR